MHKAHINATYFFVVDNYIPAHTGRELLSLSIDSVECHEGAGNLEASCRILYTIP